MKQSRTPGRYTRPVAFISLQSANNYYCSCFMSNSRVFVTISFIIYLEIGNVCRYKVRCDIQKVLKKKVSVRLHKILTKLRLPKRVKVMIPDSHPVLTVLNFLLLVSLSLYLDCRTTLRWCHQRSQPLSPCCSLMHRSSLPVLPLAPCYKSAK